MMIVFYVFHPVIYDFGLIEVERHLPSISKCYEVDLLKHYQEVVDKVDKEHLFVDMGYPKNFLNPLKFLRR